MATLNYTEGGTAGLPVTALDKIGVIENIVDYSKTESGAGDVVQVLNIPAGFYVVMAGAEVVKAEGAAAAGTFGDGAAAAGYHTTLNSDATAGTIIVSAPVVLTEAAPNTVTGYSNGKFYSAADTIDHVTTAALDAAVIRYFALVVNLTGE